MVCALVLSLWLDHFRVTKQNVCDHGTAKLTKMSEYMHSKIIGLPLGLDSLTMHMKGAPLG